MSGNDSELGLYRKFEVKRTNGTDGPGQKHDGCRYFVLDLDHDEFSEPAIRAYMWACKDKFPALASDLWKILWLRKDQWPELDK